MSSLACRSGLRGRAGARLEGRSACGACADALLILRWIWLRSVRTIETRSSLLANYIETNRFGYHECENDHARSQVTHVDVSKMFNQITIPVHLEFAPWRVPFTIYSRSHLSTKVVHLVFARKQARRPSPEGGVRGGQGACRAACLRASRREKKFSGRGVWRGV